MKILFINSVCGVGSTGRICTDLYDEFSKNGYECCIAYGRGNASQEYKTYKIGNTLSTLEHVLETRLFDNHGFASRRATKKFINFLETYNPDIISLHNVHGYFLNLKILCEYLSTTKAKLFWTLHDGWLFSGHGAHPSLNEQGNPITIGTDRREKKLYPKSFVNNSKRNFLKKKELILKIDNIHFITPSIWLNEVASKTFLKRFSFKTINNGIDLNKFYVEKENATNKEIILGVASFWSKEKGIDVFNDLAARIDNSQYEIVLVGNSPKKINKNIRKILKTNSQDELRNIYNKAKYFINPTFQDTFPTVNLESLACGTPVITFKTGGSPEMLDEETGIVLEQKNANAIYEILEKKPLFSKELCHKKGREYDKRKKNKEYLDYIESFFNCRK
ncbi:glycosyltransferase [uncultured Enterococcus sp.]|uniref:glycosyltransferase n=1 Tax=uncultured Enterococcus sp. TaxID=167972 RepID=UPI002803D8D6|nr:glycosyltransferase [uncultured Enterococcus sp.]